MSKDQLGWDQILAQDEAAKASGESTKTTATTSQAQTPTAGSVESSQSTSSSVPASAEPKKPATRKKKKAVTEGSEQAKTETAYAKKNWGRLEFPSSIVASETKSEITSELSVLAVSPEKTEILVEKTTVTKTANRASASKVTATVAVTPSRAPATGAQAALAKLAGVVGAKVSPIGDVGGKSDGIGDASDELSALKSQEPEVMSVSELNKNIRDILEGRFPLLWIKAEISNFKAHTSGHFYFSLKDAKAQISAVMFRGFNSQLRFRPEDGMEVLVRGKVTVYEPRGNYQIFCELMEPVGAGALQKAYEQLKNRLQKEGLFDETRKRALPALPKHIVIVTSPTGAAIRDMLNVLSRRFKGANITVIPCKVQGDAAPREICAAIALANRLTDVDVMIIGRGGGSIEDLWAFNDEKVARAIAGSKVPTISAVGHEVDFTIADFVADLRAPTPSAAAELVVKNAADLQERIAGLSRGLRYAVLRRLNSARQTSVSIARRLVDPQRRIQDAVQRCDELLQRLQSGAARAVADRRLRVEPLAQQLRTEIRHLLTRKRELLGRNIAVLDTLSPLKVLDRGYSMVVVDGKVVTHAGELKVGDEISIRMCKGSIEAKVTKIDPDKR